MHARKLRFEKTCFELDQCISQRQLNLRQKAKGSSAAEPTEPVEVEDVETAAVTAASTTGNLSYILQFAMHK